MVGVSTREPPNGDAVMRTAKITLALLIGVAALARPVTSA
jgi:hypothetical protein